MNLLMDKNELVNKIRGIEGLTNDEKSALIEMLRKQKKYGLVWEDKPEDVEERLREELPMLIEDTDKAIISTDTDAPNHILIEGDNLEALTALAYTHEGNIDVIYIDPPYNTGNKDFVYNDKFVDSEDSYRHSKWLSFMNKRLRIAKQLLSDKGVIFISIDDNEHAQLKLLCDEVFGLNNLCGNIIWRKKSGGGQTDAFFVTEHEYILVYRKTDQFIWQDETVAISEDTFKYMDERGRYKITPLEKWGSSAHREDRPSMYFAIKRRYEFSYKKISSRHSHNGGRWIWKEDKRLNKSSLKFPLTISCSKSRFVATITRTSTCIRVSTTNFHKLPGLKNTQQPGLQRNIHFSYLI